MKEKSKKDLPFLDHILDSINAIENFLKDSNKQEFLRSRLKQSAVVREIEVIGEAVKNISNELKNIHKEIKWKDIAGTRDKMIHHYFGVDLDIVWNIVTMDLPNLKTEILAIKKEISLKVKD